MEQELYYSLFVNKGPWLPIDHSENNLVCTDQLFKIFKSPSSLSYIGLPVPELAFHHTQEIDWNPAK